MAEIINKGDTVVATWDGDAMYMTVLEIKGKTVKVQDCFGDVHQKRLNSYNMFKHNGLIY